MAAAGGSAAPPAGARSQATRGCWKPSKLPKVHCGLLGHPHPRPRAFTGIKTYESRREEVGQTSTARVGVQSRLVRRGSRGEGGLLRAPALGQGECLGETGGGGGRRADKGGPSSALLPAPSSLSASRGQSCSQSRRRVGSPRPSLVGRLMKGPTAGCPIFQPSFLHFLL